LQLSDYVIVGTHLCRKIIVIKNDDIQYMNYSVAIENSKYFRNSLLFSLGFILAEGIETEPFEPILRKLSQAFLALEVRQHVLQLITKSFLRTHCYLSDSEMPFLIHHQNESEFLFSESTKPQIQDVLKKLYEDLIEKGETFINLDESNVLTAKVFEAPKEPIEIFDYNVPILRYDRISDLNIPWDISLNYLLSRIDGVSHIKKIASRKPAIDIDCVKRCLRTLLFYDCVVISDAIQFTNIYQLQKAVHSIVTDVSTMMSIQAFCCIDPEDPPNITDIIRFLLKFRPGKQLSQVLISAGVDLLRGLDVRRLVAIAQDFKIITRLHEYPVYIFEQKEDRVRITAQAAPGQGPGAGTSRMESSESTTDVQKLLGSANHKASQLNSGPPFSATASCKETSGTASLNAIKNRKMPRRDIVAGQVDTPASSDAITVDVSAALRALNGDVCLDSICCTYDIAPAEILEFQKYYIIYK
jgi:nitrogen permease regulator 2-like protein